MTTPSLRWSDVARYRPPALTALLEKSAVASASMRTIGPRTTLGEGYVSVGAGARSTTEELTAGLAFDASEAFETGSAADAYARRIGAAPGDARVLALGAPDAVHKNSTLPYGAEAGALGDALRRAGRRTAVIANGDLSLDATVQRYRRELTPYHREAALALMDSQGRVTDGSVGRRLLRLAPGAPFGISYDTEVVAAEFATAWTAADVVLLELSDLARADAYAAGTAPAARRSTFREALRMSDQILADAMTHVDLARHLVIVVSPAPPLAREQLTVAAIAGPGVRPGLAKSATTRRAGYVTLPDVAPAALRALGVPVPAAMVGPRLVAAGGDRPDIETFRNLADDNRRSVFREQVVTPVSVAFVVLQVLTYALCGFAVARRWRRWRQPVCVLALVTLLVPPLGFLAGLIDMPAMGLWGFPAALFGVALAGAIALALVFDRRSPVLAPALAVGLTLAVLLIDGVAGGHLQIDTVFGYSPIVAGRFAGFGNLAYALVASAAIIVATALWYAAPPRRLLLAGAVLAVALVVDGHPAWGSDVGGVLASVPAFVTVLALLAAARLPPHRLAATALAALAAVGVFTAVDLLRPDDARTHLGRLAARVGEGDFAEFARVVQRKVEANLHILFSSIWTLMLPVAAGVIVLLVRRSPTLVQTVSRRVPGVRACVGGVAVAGGVGFALNDSGVAVPAMMLAVILPYLSYLSARTMLE